jgi:hypothetical protein
MKHIARFFSALRGRVLGWLSEFAAPGPLETDGFRNGDTVFQRLEPRRPR